MQRHVRSRETEDVPRVNRNGNKSGRNGFDRPTLRSTTTPSTYETQLGQDKADIPRSNRNLPSLLENCRRLCVHSVQPPSTSAQSPSDRRAAAAAVASLWPSSHHIYLAWGRIRRDVKQAVRQRHGLLARQTSTNAFFRLLLLARSLHIAPQLLLRLVLTRPKFDDDKRMAH